MRPGRAALAAMVLVCAVVALPARGEAGPVIQVGFSNPGLTPPHWTLTIRPDGGGHFHSDRSKIDADNPQAVEVPDVDRDIQASVEFAQRVFSTARRHKLFNEECESHLKVAFQGWKTLSYEGPEGQSSCVFNYSKDKEIQTLGDSLVAMATAVLEGARLENLLQYDRLGLDREMEYLVDAVNDGRVQQVCVIRGILERLVEDPGVLDRVRKRARLLLAKMRD